VTRPPEHEDDREQDPEADQGDLPDRPVEGESPEHEPSVVGDADEVVEPQPPPRVPRPAPAAPVVTDEGVYGEIPEQRRVEREYEREDRPWRDTLVRLAGIVLALSAAAWLVLFSASQATGERVAQPALESLMETMTGLTGLLALHADEVRATGEVPGYPLAVTIPPEDRDTGAARWRAVVLAQSSTILYEEGPDALNPDGAAAAAGTFSTPGGIRLLMSNLTSARHTTASALLWPVGLVALVAGAAVLAVGSRFGRFQALGFGLTAAGIPAIGVGLLGYAVVLFAGSDGSALAEAGHDIAWSLAGIPLRNGITVLVAGIVLVILARIASMLFGRPEEPEDDPVYA
jgi:hypothetical protein